METTDAPPEQPQPPQPETSSPPPHGARLLRSRHDRMIAGVAGGIAEYFDVDAAIIRIAFVILAVFGGSGVLLYFLGWLLIPEEGGRGRLLGGHRRIGRSWIAIGIAFVVLATIHPWHTEGRPWSWPLLLVGGGTVLLLLSRRRDHGMAPAPAGPDPWPAHFADDVTAAPAAIAGPRVPSITPYLVAGLALLAGVAALTGLTATAALAIGLLLAGGALVAGAVRGRMGLTPVLVVLAGAGLILSLVAPPGLGDGIGNRTFQPASAAELQQIYRLGIGHLVVDLSALHGAAVPLRARLGIGELVVIVPAGASISIHEHTGLGGSSVFGDDQGGLAVDRTAVRGAVDGTINGTTPDFRLDARVGIGRVEVQRAVA